MPVLVALVTILTPAEAQNALLPHAKALAKDKSWRVRYMVADQIVDVRSVPAPSRAASGEPSWTHKRF